MEKKSKIYLAGHDGLVGSAILKNLLAKGYENIITRKFKDLNLIDQNETASFFKKEKPEYVFLAAAKVGGIMANNTYRAQFIYENVQIHYISVCWQFRLDQWRKYVPGEDKVAQR